MRAADGMLFCGRNVCGGRFAEVGIGIGDDARGRRLPGCGETDTDAGVEEAGVRVRDARSGSSSDFFLCRRERCTLCEAEDGFGEPPRMGEWWDERAGESRREWADWGFEDVLPILEEGRGRCGREQSEQRGSFTGAVLTRSAGAATSEELGEQRSWISLQSRGSATSWSEKLTQTRGREKGGVGRGERGGLSGRGRTKQANVGCSTTRGRQCHRATMLEHLCQCVVRVRTDKSNPPVTLHGCSPPPLVRSARVGPP